MPESDEVVEKKDPTHYSKLDPKTLKVLKTSVIVRCV